MRSKRSRQRRKVCRHHRTSGDIKYKLGEFLRGLYEPFAHSDFTWVFLTRLLVTMGIFTVQEFLQYYLGDVIGAAKLAAVKEADLVRLYGDPDFIPSLTLAEIVNGPKVPVVRSKKRAPKKPKAPAKGSKR